MTKYLVSISNYADYASSNYGSSRCVSIGNLDLYFSYKTIVAFATPGVLVVCQNVWSKTTGRHLNCIDDRNKDARLPLGEFKQELEVVLRKYKLLRE